MLFLIICFAIGCSGVSVTKHPQSDLNIHAVCMAYMDSIQPNGKGPLNIEPIKKALRDAGKNPEETLISPNDGLAYGIVWGLNPQSDNSKIMVFEKKGKDGKRQVVDMRRNPFYLTEEEFKKAPFPNGFDPEK